MTGEIFQQTAGNVHANLRRIITVIPPITLQNYIIKPQALPVIPTQQHGTTLEQRNTHLALTTP